MYHVFEYLMKYHNSDIVIDPNDQVIYQNNFERQYWTEKIKINCHDILLGTL